MTDGGRTQQLRNDLRGSFDRAYSALVDHKSAAGLLELYEHGLITSMEVLNYVWRAFHDDVAARNLVCDQLRAHDADSIRKLPDIFDEPGFQKPPPDG